MSVVKNSYEVVLVFTLSKGEEEQQKLTAKFKDLIEANAEEVTVETWGKRRLAYPINDETDGHYELITFKSVTEFPLELERILNITDGVLRYLVINKN